MQYTALEIAHIEGNDDDELAAARDEPVEVDEVDEEAAWAEMRQREGAAMPRIGG